MPNIARFKTQPASQDTARLGLESLLTAAIALAELSGPMSQAFADRLLLLKRDVVRARSMAEAEPSAALAASGRYRSRG